MAIKSYLEDGKEYFRVYVHVRSKTSRKKRIQKNVKGFKTMAEAKKAEKKILKEASYEIAKMDGQGIDWVDIVHLWNVEIKAGYMGNMSPRSVQEYNSTIEKWTKPWAKIPASCISRADARDLLMRMDEAGLRKTYQKKVCNIISRVYEWAIEFRYISDAERSPLRGFVFEKQEEKAPDILGLEEITKFLGLAKALSHPWYHIWAFAILTGMRSGELYALKWEQIDFEKNLILVDRSYEANLRTIGSTKGRYWRIVPINESLRMLIVELKNGPKKVGEGFILPRSKTWDNGNQAKPLRDFLKSIGVKPIKFHALRACFATQMLASGVPSPVVMKIGGWKNTKTMDIYLRLAGVDTKGATECLNFLSKESGISDNVVSFSDFQKD
ncbi:MAG: integrase [Bacteriovoracaceae bacterium]|jgi:integrase